jgi:Zn-dependent protease/CBS domain-containing protein
VAHDANRGGSAPWSLTLVTVKEIPIRIHFSFFLLLAYIAFIETGAGRGALSRILFVIAIFGCVLLHELGHALTARLFKIRTRDIVLYPFGGIASLMGEGRPKEEFFIAVAGPLVNLVLALICAPFMNFNFLDSSADAPSFATRLFLANVTLALFNLIPALPMDGGRILRSLLALMGFRRATGIATRVSQVLCIIMGIFALLSQNVILLVIAVLVFSNAVQEHLRERTKGAAVGFKVREVMTEGPLLQTFPHGMTVSQALKIALKSLQSVFPVVHSGEVIGVIDRETLLETGALDSDESYVSGHMSREFETVGPDEDLTAVLEKMQSGGSDSLLVMSEGQLVGILLKDKVLEYLLVQEFRKRSIEEAKRSDANDF